MFSRPVGQECQIKSQLAKNMNAPNTKRLLLAVTTAAGILSSFTLPSLAADGPAAPAEPKDAAEVFDRYAQAVGGTNAIFALKSRVSTGEATLEQYNVTGNVELVQQAPNRFFGAWKLDDVGSFDRGFDGKTGWSKSPIDGVKDLDGLGLEALKEEAELHLPARMKEFFPGARLAAKRKGDGGGIQVVEVPGKDRTNELHFAVTSGLLVGWKRQVESQGGVVTEEAKLTDYRAVDGVKVPFMTRKETPQLTSVTTLTEVKHNVEVTGPKFAKPAN